LKQRRRKNLNKKWIASKRSTKRSRRRGRKRRKGTRTRTKTRKRRKTRTARRPTTRRRKIVLSPHRRRKPGHPLRPRRSPAFLHSTRTFTVCDSRRNGKSRLQRETENDSSSRTFSRQFQKAHQAHQVTETYIQCRMSAYPPLGPALYHSARASSTTSLCYPTKSIRASEHQFSHTLDLPSYCEGRLLIYTAYQFALLPGQGF
ncbi:hypothetical protein CI238_02197, partial [Colletotrichum incanum]